MLRHAASRALALAGATSTCAGSSAILRSAGAPAAASAESWALSNVQRAAALAAATRAGAWSDQLRRSSGAAAQSTAAPAAPAELALTESCVQRLRQLRAEGARALRVYVDGGGCSGFQYRFELDAAGPQPDDRVVVGGGGEGGEAPPVLVDSVSYEFLKGAKLDYSQELIRASFQVIDNPNTEKTCGCGSSFAVKL